MSDPRRTIVMFHSNSNSPCARRWYRIAEACEFDGELFLHRDYIKDSVAHRHEINGATPRTKADAISKAKAHAKATSRAYVPGMFSGQFGNVLRSEDRV